MHMAMMPHMAMPHHGLFAHPMAMMHAHAAAAAHAHYGHAAAAAAAHAAAAAARSHVNGASGSSNSHGSSVHHPYNRSGHVSTNAASKAVASAAAAAGGGNGNKDKGVRTPSSTSANTATHPAISASNTLPNVPAGSIPSVARNKRAYGNKKPGVKWTKEEVSLVEWISVKCGLTLK